MIRYDITETELRARIDRQKADWQTRAASATALYRRAGKYGEPDDKNWDAETRGVPPSPFWGQIKAVYMKLQKNKCAFCERELTTRPKDHDIEHFRPKRAVVSWPSLPMDPPPQLRDGLRTLQPGPETELLPHRRRPPLGAG